MWKTVRSPTKDDNKNGSPESTGDIFYATFLVDFLQTFLILNEFYLMFALILPIFLLFY